MLKQGNAVSAPGCHNSHRYLTILETIILAAFSCYAVWSIQTLLIVYFHLPFHYLKYAAAFAALSSGTLVWALPAGVLANHTDEAKSDLKIYFPNFFLLLAIVIIITAGSIVFIKTG